MNNKSPLLSFLMFIFFTPMLIVSAGYAMNVGQDLNLDTAIGIKDTLSYSVESDWDSFGVLDNLQTDSDILYAGQNQQGTWTSYIQDVPRNRVLDLTYTAQIEDGNANLTVRAWANDPEGNFSNPDESRTFELMTGEHTETLNYTEYDYFDVVVTLEETGGNSNQLPHLDSLNIDFQILEGEQIGLSKDEVTIWTLLLVVSGFIQFIMAMLIIYSKKD